jgi:hypothetical protein
VLEGVQIDMASEQSPTKCHANDDVERMVDGLDISEVPSLKPQQQPTEGECSCHDGGDGDGAIHSVHIQFDDAIGDGAVAETVDATNRH